MGVLRTSMTLATSPGSSAMAWAQSDEDLSAPFFFPL